MMPVVILFGLLGIVVVAAVVLLASNRWPDPGLVDDPGDRVPPAMTEIPVGELHPDDVDTLRLDVSARGYRMDEVDAVIARLTAEIAARDAALAAGDGPPVPTSVPPEPDQVDPDSRP
jgi:DivIVA domain-containing protein